MILKLNKIHKQYPSADNTEAVKVLENLNLEIHQKETVAIIGQSGCGKSTLLSLIAGLDSPTTGEVILDGQSLQTMNEETLAKYRSKQIGIVFQRFHLMPHLTALENVSLPLELSRQRNSQQQAAQTLETMGLGHRKNHFPHQLSGGECQRVAIARALVIKPALLLADEPTGNLDEKTGEKLSDILFDMVESISMTLLLVTHNHSLAHRCQRKLQLRDGSLHETMD
ncbi:MAG: ABC transporter ATP-binding protein [SAR324 cluster bacterium]|uniref:ABC transporter ATP-binding protein n=1 Tax=SAR324 cluster bacterium TaxID=2024889 RepID=A0A2A4TAN0_9DELT|nr:MAG: ABC transporter ATP-binding protein [SAR324 cluster bacterium]